MSRHILLLTLLLVANLAFPRFIYGSCRLVGSEAYPVDGDISVPTNVLVGPEYGDIKNEQGDLVETEQIVRNAEHYLRPKDNLVPNTAYTVWSPEGWISFTTGNGPDTSSPTISGSVSAWEDSSNQFFQLQSPFDEDECAKLGVVHIEIDAIDEIGTAVSSLRGGLLSVDGNASFLRRIKGSQSTLLLELDTFTDADELTFILIDGAGNQSTPYTVQIRHLGSGCGCDAINVGYEHLFLVVVPAVLLHRKGRRRSLFLKYSR